MMEAHTKRLVVGITGATGSLFGIRLLEALRGSDVETHLVISKWGGRTLMHETSYTLDQVQKLATCCYSANDQGAALCSVRMELIDHPCSN